MGEKAKASAMSEAIEATRILANKQQNVTREQQERIHAEAKARVRFAGDATIIQNRDLAKTSAAFEDAQAQVKTLKAEYEAAIGKYKARAAQYTALLKDIEQRKLVIMRAAGTAKMKETHLVESLKGSGQHLSSI